MVAIPDPRYANQWHFKWLGDIAAIWQDYGGAGVSVGVYDDGMDQTHEDLAANYDASLHYSSVFYTDDGRHTPQAEGHGTAVGGLIAAARNGLGGVGVAWGAHLTSVDYLGTIQDLSDQINNDALRYSATFDIVNQSYGVTPDYDSGADIGDPGSWAYAEAQALLHAATQGRGGLGTVIVKSAGNEANDPTLTSMGLFGNAQGESRNSQHIGITVGAFDQAGMVEYYSNYGHTLLVSAPAASNTTDITGAAGYAAGAYSDGFGGTSAAAPVTSGVVALMLQANPGLGARDVRNILAASAAQVGSAYGSAGAGHEVGGWMALGGHTWNGGAMSFHQSYGYGAVDAFAAVRMAEVWSLLHGAALTETTLITRQASARPDTVISAAGPAATARITMEAGMVIEHAYVTVDLTHSFAGDLVCDLIAPDGSVITLFNREGGASAITDDWTFGVASLRGMSSGGTWTLRVADHAAADDGLLRGVTLELLGAPQTVDDVWTMTDDFEALARVDPARRILNDSNGGNDWLNTVAMAQGLTIALGDVGTDGRVRAGLTELARLTDGAIENLATGDGNDSLTGSEGDNHIVAGRGRNILYGQGGSDTLEAQGTANVLIGEDRGLYGTAHSAQVFRLYDAVFGRAPDTGGHQAHSARLAAGQSDLTGLAQDFVGSAEFTKRYGSDTTDTEFLTLTYGNVLGRAPAPQEVEAWLARMGAGTSRAEVVVGFSESPEHIRLTGGALQDYETGADPTQWVAYVYRLFGAIFGREPGARGLDLWVGELVDDYGPDGLAQAFMGSAEFTNVYGGTSNGDFIQKLYQNVLHRDPDAQGLNTWTRALDAGLSRQEAVQRFAQTPEYVAASDPALKLYMTALGPDDVLRAGSAAAVLSGGLYADRFVFAAANQSRQQVTDFEAWDSIALEGFGYGSVAEALEHFSQQGEDVVFSDSGVEVVLDDIELALIAGDTLILV